MFKAGGTWHCYRLDLAQGQFSKWIKYTAGKISLAPAEFII